MKARCPKCGSTRLLIAVHTMYAMEDGVFTGEVVTDGPDENLTEEDTTICPKCDYDNDFHMFEVKE